MQHTTLYSRGRTGARHLGTAQLAFAAFFFLYVITYESWGDDGGFTVFSDMGQYLLVLWTVWYVVFSGVVYGMFRIQFVKRDVATIAAIYLLCVAGHFAGKDLHSRDIERAYHKGQTLLAELKKYRAQHGTYPPTLDSLPDTAPRTLWYGGRKRNFMYSMYDSSMSLRFATGWYYHYLGEDGTWVMVD